MYNRYTVVFSATVFGSTRFKKSRTGGLNTLYYNRKGILENETFYCDENEINDLIQKRKEQIKQFFEKEKQIYCYDFNSNRKITLYPYFKISIFSGILKVVPFEKLSTDELIKKVNSGIYLKYLNRD